MQNDEKINKIKKDLLSSLSEKLVSDIALVEFEKVVMEEFQKEKIDYSLDTIKAVNMGMQLITLALGSEKLISLALSGDREAGITAGLLVASVDRLITKKTLEKNLENLKEQP